jgi:5-oxoprolinase (ATP-hydrolysing) subunit A
MTIDLNCDMGEGMGNEAAIMPFISSANIACGYHAGDDASIRETIRLCLQHNVAVGAHPGFADKENFGRVPIRLPDNELYQLISSQLGIMQTICDEMNAKLHHVKPHGALYNVAAADAQMSSVIAKAVYDFNPSLVYYGLSGSAMVKEAAKVGLKVAHEVFADRTYQPDGALTSRKQPDALITKAEAALNQVNQMLFKKSVTAVDGIVIPIHVDTICIHGDGPHALEFAWEIQQYLVKAGIGIKAFGLSSG